VKPDPVIARHLKDLLEKTGFLRSQQRISAVELRKDLGTRLAIERAFQLAMAGFQGPVENNVCNRTASKLFAAGTEACRHP